MVVWLPGPHLFYRIVTKHNKLLFITPKIIIKIMISYKLYDKIIDAGTIINADRRSPQKVIFFVLKKV